MYGNPEYMRKSYKGHFPATLSERYWVRYFGMYGSKILKCKFWSICNHSSTLTPSQSMCTLVPSNMQPLPNLKVVLLNTFT